MKNRSSIATFVFWLLALLETVAGSGAVASSVVGRTSAPHDTPLRANVAYDVTIASDRSENFLSAYEDAARLPTANNGNATEANGTHVGRIGESVAAESSAGSELALSPWPANRGFIEGTVERKLLMPGETFDRYGFGGGKFGSPTGTAPEIRSLRPGAEALPYNNYQVVKPFEVNSGEIAPAFNQPGLGTQYEFPVSIDVLLKRGIIK